MKKSFFFKTKAGVELEMMVERRGRRRRWPTVLLVPGFHSDLHEWGYFDQIVSGLVKHGFCVYRLSFSGSGKSGGEVYDITLTHQVEELREVVAFIRRQPEVDWNRCGLLAQSFGVATAIAALPLPVASMVFTSGAYRPEKSMAELFRDQGVWDPQRDSHFEKDYDSVRVGPRIWRDLRGYDLEKCIRQYQGSLLILHGKKDHVPWRWAVRLFEKANEPKEIELPEGGGHGFEL